MKNCSHDFFLTEELKFSLLKSAHGFRLISLLSRPNFVAESMRKEFNEKLARTEKEGEMKVGQLIKNENIV